MGPSATRLGGPAGSGAPLQGPPLSAAQSAQWGGLGGLAGRWGGRAADLARSCRLGRVRRNVVPKRFGTFVNLSWSATYKFVVFKMGLKAFTIRRWAPQCPCAPL